MTVHDMHSQHDNHTVNAKLGTTSPHDPNHLQMNGPLSIFRPFVWSEKLPQCFRVGFSLHGLRSGVGDERPALALSHRDRFKVCQPARRDTVPFPTFSPTYNSAVLLRRCSSSLCPSIVQPRLAIISVLCVRGYDNHRRQNSRQDFNTFRKPAFWL